MKKRKGFLIFFSVILVFLTISKNLLESNIFATWLNKKIVQKFALQNDVIISFKNLDLNLLEQRIMLIDVFVEYKEQIVKGDLGFGFNLDLLFSKKLNLSNIVFENGELSIHLPKNRSNQNEKDILDQFNEVYIGLYEKLLENSIRNLEISNVKIQLFRNEKIVSSAIINKANFSIMKLSRINSLVNLVDIKYESYLLDSFKLQAVFEKSKIFIEKFEALNGFSQIKNDSILEYDLFKKKILAKFKLVGIASDWQNIYDLDSFKFGELLKNNKYNVGLILEFKNDKISVSGDFQIDSYGKSKIFKRISGEIILTENEFELKNISVLDNDQGNFRFESMRYSKVGKKFITPSIVKIKNYKVIPEAPFMLKIARIGVDTVLDGELEIMYENSIVFLSSKEFKTKNVCIKTRDQKNILCTPRVNGKFGIEIADNIELNYELSVNGSMFLGKGSFTDKLIEVDLKKTKIKTGDLYNIFDLEILANGLISARYQFDFINNQQNLFLKLDLDNFEIEKINLGNISGDVKYDFFNNKLDVSSAKGKVQSSIYSGFGFFDFTDKTKVNLNINFKNINGSDLRIIIPKYIAPIQKEIGFLKTSGNANVKIWGGLSLDELNITSAGQGDSLTYKKEDFSKFNYVFNLKNKKITISPIQIYKGDSVINGRFDYDLLSQKMFSKAVGRNLFINDFHYYRLSGLGLKSKFDIEFNFNDLDNFILSGNLLDSSVSQFDLGQSNFLLERKNKSFIFNINLFNNSVLLKGKLFNEGINRKFEILSEVDINNIGPYLGVISDKNIENGKVDGRIKFDFSSRGSLDTYKYLDFDFLLHEFSFRRENVQLAVVYPYNQIKISKGKVLSDLLKIGGNNQNIQFYLTQDRHWLFFNSSFKIPGSIFEIAPQVFNSWNGTLDGSAHFKYFDLNSINLNLSARNNEVTLSFFPMLFSNVNFDIFSDSNIISVDSLSAELGGGRVDLDGYMEIRNDYPKINFNYILSSSRFKFLESSYFDLGGSGKLFGSTIPYFFNSKLKVIDGEINVDPKNFLNKNENVGGQIIKAPDLLDFNIEIESLNKISIKNSITDLKVDLALKFLGPGNLIETNGKITIDENNSKLFFKGHNFKITKGDVFLRKSTLKIDPYFDIKSETKISDYNLEMEIVGDVKNLSVSFRSDPPLPEPDILSLLTLGITMDTSRDLQDSDLESVTSMSLGSLLIDQFGINQGLNDSLGIKVSVNPEFSDDNINPIAGKINSSTDSARLRSATKLRLSKRISNSINLNYSSTLGGSLDQSQQMNIDFKINKEMSLQGVYRTQTNETSENIDTTESIGFDFIWKKTFK